MSRPQMEVPEKQKNSEVYDFMLHWYTYSLIQPHLSAPNPPKVMLSTSAVLHL